MKEYIEKSEAVERALYTPIMSSGPVDEKDTDAWTDGAADAQDQIAKSIGKIPAADVVERKRGEWVDAVYDPVWKKMKATCNSCQCRGEVRVKSNCCGFAVPDSDFCPNCGADMREVDHE